jgi:hypothetical protein
MIPAPLLGLVARRSVVGVPAAFPTPRGHLLLAAGHDPGAKRAA